MDILRERLENIKNYDPTSQIIIVWSVEDVLKVRPDLSFDQANDVLQQIKNKHDATVGITWDTIECVTEMLYPEEG